MVTSTVYLITRVVLLLLLKMLLLAILIVIFAILVAIMISSCGSAQSGELLLVFMLIKFSKVVPLVRRIL